MNFTAKKAGWLSLVSGNYRKEGASEIQLTAWALQLLVWGIIVVIVIDIQGKLFVLVLLSYTQHYFAVLGVWALAPLSTHPRAELVVVMVAVPLVLNMLQFWIQDNILKARTSEFLIPIDVKDDLYEDNKNS